MKEISQKTREQRIKKFISSIKFLFDPKYYKTNKVSCADYQSWAAQGQAGGCRICNANYYNFTIHNKRNTGKSGKGKYRWSNLKFGNLCSNCYYEVEKQCDYQFEKY